MTKKQDLVLVGNVGRNTMHRFDGTTEPIIGGPIVQAALATAWSDKRVSVATRMAAADADLLSPLRQAQIEVFVSHVPETTRGHIYYVSEDVEDRRHKLERSAGPFSLADLHGVEARHLHLAGVNRLEFPLDFMQTLGKKGISFSVDMQALVRDVDLETGEVTYCDYPHKREIAALAEGVKLDAVEGRLLTGSSDLGQAAIQFERWGTPEVMVTATQGALVRCRGRTYFEPFTNRNTRGRTGRGDTVFAAYLARRFDSGVSDSLKFACALCSLKMENAGLFTATLEQVLARMGADRRQEGKSS